jgi:uridylate kinase
LRAVEIEAGALLKGTHGGTDGIYTADPRVDPDAEKLDQISYLDVIKQGLQAMDTTAITLCMENEMPVVYFDLLGRQRAVHPRRRTDRYAGHMTRSRDPHAPVTEPAPVVAR